MLPKRIKHRLNVIADLWDYFTILSISSYNVRPQYAMYWTRSEDVICPLARIMSRNRFSEIKSFLHVCNNNELNNDDKWAKLRPLFDVVNKKLIQFGVFSHYLSIDEQMVPYFGRHSYKQFIRGKPIHFGYEF